MGITSIVIWGIIGIANLICGDISRVGYGCVWAVLMINLIQKAVG